MNVREAVKKRRSVRSYQDKEIPEQEIREILDSARLAPSASNRQDWKFIVVKDENLRSNLVKAANNQSFVGEAPVIIVAVSLNPERIMSCEVPAYAVDLSIAMDHITLVAAEKGLGTCWIGAFSQSEVKNILDIPEKYKVLTLMPLGYPADSPGTKSRKDFEEIICYNKFD
ncbi:MAG: nitroreductase family protein [Bacillota bacterium]